MYERGLSRLMHDDLHWLTVPQRLQYKLAVTVNRCLQHRAPRHLTDYCVPVFEVPSRQHLRSTRYRQLTVPRVHSAFRSRAFSIVGPTVWNSLSDDMGYQVTDSFIWNTSIHRT